ncbi:MAG: recombinase family protein [Clostridiales bacterium]|nr:recombinase family protein [Clostridiales bacterium]
MKIAIYARVSTEEQAQKHSIDAQLDLLRGYAQAREYKIYKEYTDPGYSGTLHQRPGYQKLIDDAIDGKFKLIIVYKIDRLFRSTRHLLNVVHELEVYGVDVCSATEPFDTGTAVGKFTMQLFASVAELERNIFLQRSELGRIKRLEKGMVWGSQPPFGYIFDKSNSNLKIYQPEAKIVKLIFELYCQADTSTNRVADELNKRGYRTRHKKAWYSDGVSVILRRTAYMGRQAYNKMTNDPKVCRDEKEWVWVDVPPIVSIGKFNTAQKLLDERRWRRPSANISYLLNDKLYCGYCGTSMRGGIRGKRVRLKSSDKDYLYLYYGCGNSGGPRQKRKKGVKDGARLTCAMKLVPVEKIEELVWGQIKNIVTNPQIVLDAAERQKGKGNNKNKDIEKKIVMTSRKIEKVDIKRKSVITLYRENIINKMDLITQLDEIEIESSLLEEEKRRYVSQMEMWEQDEIVAMSLIDLCKEVEDKIGILDYTERRKIIDLIIDKIVVGIDGSVEMHLALPTQKAGLWDSVITIRMDADVLSRRKEVNKTTKQRRGTGMVERSGGFTNEMWQKIERLSLDKKVTAAEMIRQMVSRAAQHNLINVDEYKIELLSKRKINMGFTDKRRPIHFTQEQVDYIEGLSALLNRPVTDVIRLCVSKYFDVYKLKAID